MKPKEKAIIANLPRGVGVGRVHSGSGRPYWRVRLGRKFTGGKPIMRDFVSLSEARAWVFGDVQNERAPVRSIISLVERARETVSGLTAKQISEAAAAFRRLESASITLTAAVDFALRHALPEAGTMSVADAITQALIKAKANRRPSYVADLEKRWRRFERWLAPQKRSTLNAIMPSDIRACVTFL